MASPYNITDPSRMHRGRPRAGTPTKTAREKLLAISVKARRKNMVTTAWETEYRHALADMHRAASKGRTKVAMRGILTREVKFRLSFTDNITIREVCGCTILSWF
jgi:hypothetical protein